MEKRKYTWFDYVQEIAGLMFITTAIVFFFKANYIASINCCVLAHIFNHNIVYVYSGIIGGGQTCEK